MIPPVEVTGVQTMNLSEEKLSNSIWKTQRMNIFEDDLLQDLDYFKIIHQPQKVKRYKVYELRGKKSQRKTKLRWKS